MKTLLGLVVALVLVLGGIGTVSAYDEISPQDACNMVKNYPDTYILDVRTPWEWYWIGHPGEDKCGRGDFLEGRVKHIPFWLWKFSLIAKTYSWEENKLFDLEVTREFHPGDTIILMCRSGGRGGLGCTELETPTHPIFKRLEELGEYTLYNMSGGFEGGTDNCGYRTLEAGWKNNDLPYKYGAEGIWTPLKSRKALLPQLLQEYFE
jgi:rhodanese-related sulfurtransferase